MNIPKDKIYHFCAGLIIMLIAGYIGNDSSFGLLGAVFAGCAKEVYDWWDYGEPDMLDFAATFLGGVIGCAAVQLWEIL